MIKFIKKYWGSYVFKTTLIVSLTTLILLGGLITVSRFRAVRLNLDTTETRLIDLGNIAIHFFTPTLLQNIENLTATVQKYQAPLDKQQSAFPNNATTQDTAKFPPVTATVLREIEATADYQNTLKVLRVIRDSTYRPEGVHRNLMPQIRDVYVLAPMQINNKIVGFTDVVDDYSEQHVNNMSGYWRKKMRLGSVVPADPVFMSAWVGSPYVQKSSYRTAGEWWLISAFPLKNPAGKVVGLLVLEYNAIQPGTPLAQFWQYFYFIVPLALGLGLIFSMLISRQLTRPISLLTQAADRVRQRDYSVQISTHGQDQIGLLTETFNSMIREIRTHTMDLEKLVASYARFVPHEFLDLLSLQSITEVELGNQVERFMSVLFCDIRSFTTTLEYLSPQAAIEFLNNYLQFVAPIVRLHHGYIDKYIGDAIMALFPANAADAVNCAIELLKETEKFNAAQALRDLPPISIAIGVHSGKLMLGTVGETLRMEATVISNTVNVSARIDTLAKQLNIDAVISADTQQSILTHQQFVLRYIGQLRAKGKRETIGLYEVLNHLPPSVIELKLATAAELRTAIDLVEEGSFKAAEALLSKLKIMLPEDGVILNYLLLCQKREMVLTNH